MASYGDMADEKQQSRTVKIPSVFVIINARVPGGNGHLHQDILKYCLQRQYLSWPEFELEPAQWAGAGLAHSRARFGKYLARGNWCFRRINGPIAGLAGRHPWVGTMARQLSGWDQAQCPAARYRVAGRR